METTEQYLYDRLSFLRAKALYFRELKNMAEKYDKTNKNKYNQQIKETNKAIEECEKSLGYSYTILKPIDQRI